MSRHKLRRNWGGRGGGGASRRSVLLIESWTRIAATQTSKRQENVTSAKDPTDHPCHHLTQTKEMTIYLLLFLFYQFRASFFIPAHPSDPSPRGAAVSVEGCQLVRARIDPGVGKPFFLVQVCLFLDCAFISTILAFYFNLSLLLNKKKETIQLRMIITCWLVVRQPAGRPVVTTTADEMF